MQTDKQPLLFEKLMWNVLSFRFQLPEDFEVMFDEAAGEITIGGIYLRLFIQQPAWVGSLNRFGFLMVVKSETKVFSFSHN